MTGQGLTNISSLKMMVLNDHRDVLANIGFDKYARLLEICDQYLVVYDKLIKNLQMS